MILKKSLFSEKKERKINGQSNYKSIKPVYFENFSTKVSKRIALTSGICIFLIGISILVFQSYGYNVYYDGEILGFVDDPYKVTSQFDEINTIISQEKGMEAIISEDKFSFERGIRLFHSKESLKEIATAANEKCDIDVNVYNVYIDDVCVAQDSTISNFEKAIDTIKENYKAAYPDDDYETIGFTQKVEVRIVKGSEAKSMTFDEMNQLLASSLVVKTTSYVKEQTVIPYEIKYETTDVKNAGETAVKSAGVEGLIETTKLVEKNNGVQVSSTDVESKVLVEKVDQVVLIGTNGLQINQSGMLSPTRGTLTSRMGQRWGRLHKGIDIAGAMNEPVLAPLAGTVIAAEYNASGYGNMIKIDHGDGLVTLYGHLNQINVNVNDTVYLGQVIGLMGSTGRSTGTHLHFEVILNGVNVDPLSYVSY